MSSEFRLYPEERHWWSFADYRAVLETMRQLHPARVLEFGPGSSTLALIEGGAQTIDTCEDAPDWAQVYEERLQGTYPDIVRVHRFVLAEPLTIPSIDGQTYDLGFIDGPRGTDSRQPVVRYCLDRCTAVLVPTEDGNRAFRPFLIALAAERGWDIAIRETGPLSGGFALFTRPVVRSTPGVILGTDSVLTIETPEGHVVVDSQPAPTLTRRQRRRGKKATGQEPDPHA